MSFSCFFNSTVIKFRSSNKNTLVGITTHRPNKIPNIFFTYVVFVVSLCLYIDFLKA